jgi:hypothetical protein
MASGVEHLPSKHQAMVKRKKEKKNSPRRHQESIKKMKKLYLEMSEGQKKGQKSKVTFESKLFQISKNRTFELKSSTE